MWNLLRMRKNQKECGRLQDALERAAEAEDLSLAQREHLAACGDCRAMADERAAARHILSHVVARAAQPGPWFAPRVMAAIAAKESELRQSLEAWAAVPRLAARLTWASALALLLASTWLYQRPKSTPRTSNDGTVESLFDTAQAPVQDDIELPGEQAQ